MEIAVEEGWEKPGGGFGAGVAQGEGSRAAEAVGGQVLRDAAAEHVDAIDLGQGQAVGAGDGVEELVHGKVAQVQADLGLDGVVDREVGARDLSYLAQ